MRKVNVRGKEVHGFTGSDVQEIFSITNYQLKYWLTYGYVEASLPTTVKGSRNIFTGEDLYRIRVFMALEKVVNKPLAAEISKRLIDDVWDGKIRARARLGFLKFEVDLKKVQDEVKDMIARTVGSVGGPAT